MASAPLATSSDRVRRCFDPVIATRGELYALRGAVTIVGGGADRVSAIVRGTLPYDVELSMTRAASGAALVASCTCAHAAHALCKHAWATLRVAERRGFLTSAAREAGELAIFSALQEGHGPELRWLIDLTATRKQGYGLHVDVFERTTQASGSSTGWRPVSFARRYEEQAIFDTGGIAALSPLALAGRCEVVVGPGQPPEPLVVEPGGPFLLVLVIAEGPPGPRIEEVTMPGLLVRAELRRGAHVVPLESLTAVTATGLAFAGPRVMHVERDARYSLVRAIHAKGELTIVADRSAAFLRDVIGSCRRNTVELPPTFAVDREATFTTRVRVRRPEPTERRPALRTFAADVLFDYDGTQAPWSDRSEIAFVPPRRRIVVRDRDAEQRAIADLIGAGFVVPRKFQERRRVSIASSRLTDAILALPVGRFVVEADGIVHRRASRTSVKVRSGIDWFDLEASVDFDGVIAPLPALLRAARRGEKLVRLDDGSVGILPEGWVARLARIADLVIPETESERIGRAADPTADGHLRFKRAQIAMVDALLGEERAAVVWDGPIASLRAELHKTVDLPPAPLREVRGFQGELREYQRAGLAWLQWLEEIGFSGCLADDMGLGKTIQVLALLADRHARGCGEGPSLVVAPRSVVYNWLDEARRFAPSLRVIELRTSTADDAARGADLLVTTYASVRHSADRLARMPLDYVILDEAHAIKNTAAATTQAVRLLRSRHRLALTGTPIENHLGELASLFDFLNAGMFGPRVRAMARRGLDIGPEEAAQLGRGLRPFILRRKKSDVLTELPPRIDQTLFCTMEPGQRAVYERVKKHYQSKLLAEGMADSAFEILEALLRLRQIACHPGLVDRALQTEGSAKLDVLMEMIEPLVRQGKKALVFSQFTSLLDIVERNLGLRGIVSARLDGSTSDRRAPVERFQTDPTCNVFLVSLKAGGVGLNLTAAEYVFLLDPWWNPAAEAQAIDRAHRMGQTKTVMSYRLLCKDTIEERVAELQEKKHALVTSVFAATEATTLGSLSVADVEALLA